MLWQPESLGALGALGALVPLCAIIHKTQTCWSDVISRAHVPLYVTIQMT